jgi:alpha,alpha-trehalase
METGTVHIKGIKNAGLVFIEEYEELFVDIQSQKILADQKTFVDSEPRISIELILEAYRQQKTEKEFSLKAFYDAYFELPEDQLKAMVVNPLESAGEHIDRLWDRLTRSPGETRGTLMRLPEKFVVPGGRFREIFYWDSYFTMLGLQVSKRHDLVESMVRNFASLIESLGFIPNGNRTYFLSRSQPPFFSLMVELLAWEKGQEVWLDYRPQLEKEYAFWMWGEDILTEDHRAERRVLRMPQGEVLNRYWDHLNTPRPEGYMADIATAKKAGSTNPEIFRELRAGAESGWDFSSRWLGDGKNLSTIRTTRIVPVDLNCLLLHLERSLMKASQLAGDRIREDGYRLRAQKREAAIQKYLWSDEDGIFGDFDFVVNRLTRAATIGMVYPLFLKIATHKQVARIVVQLTGKFLQPGGLLSTLVNSGQQWDAPNGWAPMQWIGYQGVMNYDCQELGEKINRHWTANVERVFRRTGRLMEKYNVVDDSLEARGGEYPNQDGFGWTNGVYLKLKSLT